jgi:hypothetical protein
MFYILATYQLMSITAMNLTVGLMFHPIDGDIAREISNDIEEEENQKHTILS